MNITLIPKTPVCVEGIVNVRGKLVPIINTRLKLNMPKKEYDSNARIIVVEIANKTVGFIVDEVNEVIRISESKTETPPELALSDVASDYITSIARMDERMIIILDLKKLVYSNEVELSLWLLLYEIELFS